MKINQITSTLNNSPNIIKRNNSSPVYNTVSFGNNPAKEGSAFFKKIKKFFDAGVRGYDKLGEKINQKFISKIMDTKTARKIVDFTVEHPSLKKNQLSHLIAIGSLILSSFYVTRTLKNDKLDTKKRKTLAINQAAVCGSSLLMAYGIEGLINKKIDRFIEKFKASSPINKITDEVLKKAENEKLDKYIAGIKAAKTIVVFGLVNRYIAPVIITPIANAIGNRVHKKEAEAAKAQQKK